MKHRWHVTYVLVGKNDIEGSKELDRYLEMGWEPFAVTHVQGANRYSYHLRQKEKIK